MARAQCALGRWGEVVKALGSILSGDGELLPSGVTLSDLPLEGRSPGGGRGLGVRPEGDSGRGGGRAEKVGLVSMGKAARRWPPGMVQEGRVWRNGEGGEGGGTEKKLQEDLPWAWGYFGGTWGGGFERRRSVLPRRSGVWWFLGEKPGVEATCSCRWGLDRLGPRVCRVGSW